MCGITGKTYFSGNFVSERDILAMNKKLVHRGPDDGGIYISPDKKTGLGHRRLSVIDLSPLGRQPMNYLDRYWIVFNGEIYNFREERSALEKEGYRFKSKTDTEVILALYDKYGEKCLRNLRGMFAFAIYDEKEKTLFCARDRIGKKPFKYYLDGNVFIFASELKAVLAQPEYKKEPDYAAIHHYLTLQYCPAPLTGFKNIKKLEPAHYLFIDLKNGKTEKKRYWKPDYSRKMELPEKEWKRRIMEKLEEAVKIRMISDVPLGAFLSGGIDSSAVVGLMSKFSRKPVKTFSIGFEEERYNELPYARMIAEKFKTEHQEFIVKTKALVEDFPFLVRQYEEPYADSSALAAYHVSKMTKKFVTVALNGDGGDENFAGYPWYGVHKFAVHCGRFSSLISALSLPAAELFSRTIKTTFSDRVRRFAKTLPRNYRERYLNYLCYFSNESKNEIYTEKFKEKVWPNDTFKLIAEKFKESGTRNKMDQAFYADLVSYLPDDLLVKMDIATMASALESRSPFLDQEFLELTARIPARLKLKGLNGKKYILKKALEGFLPEEILYRPKKGFVIPIEDWFRKDLRQYAAENLLSQKAVSRRIFKKEKIRFIIDKHSSTEINYAPRIWALLALEFWFREYFD